MYRILSISVFCGVVGVCGVLMLLGKFYPAQPTLEACTQNRSFTIAGQAQLLCWDQDRKSVLNFGPTDTDTHLIQFENPAGKVLSFVFQSDGNATAQILDLSGKELWIGFLAPTSKESLAPAIVQVELPAGINKLLVRKLNGGEARLFDVEIREKEVSEVAVKVEHESRAFVSWIPVVIAIMGLTILVFIWPMTENPWPFVLIFTYTLLYFVEGLPFFTSVGQYDPFDDKSYLEWARHIGYQLQLNISDGQSAAADGNIHSWGTGFLLAPPFLLMRLIPALTRIDFILLTSWSVLLGLITVLIYFAAFSKIFPRWVAAIIAFLNIAGTSLTKWTFGRLIFSHAPEAFSLALGTFFFIDIYFTHRRTVHNYLGLAFALWLTIQIRRENALLILLPIGLEILNHRSTKKIALPIGFFLGTMAAGLVSLQLSNIFTRLKYFSAPVPTSNILAFEWVRLKANFVPVLFGSSGFFTVGVFVPLSCLALYFLRRKIPAVLPFLVVIVGYLVMCMIHQYPTGYEWQNRFLLKLNPIIFAGLGIVLYNSKVSMRLIICLVLAFGLWYQHGQYLANLHPHQAIFADLFTDRSMMSPFAFHTEWIFLSPLAMLLAILVLSMAGILLFRLVISTRKPMNRSVYVPLRKGSLIE